MAGKSSASNVSILPMPDSEFISLVHEPFTEAAKGVKYGGLSEEEALKLVTINPAIQLGIDKC